ncbi:MAG: ABC transporter ATP-binding protein/permease [Clostridia bacterium]|nr:ABC transporter ATP-binding protein/permease [Clostridia bacterium]
MLKLNGITKDYVTGDSTVRALNGVSLQFRKSEFVSILGPSGCGKTTLLNIVGGLDQYTDGDLIINGISTKDYCDADWDTYRNHSIGFVFQSYNLIPHQTVLANVELALTLSGISANERRARAIEALTEVGLADHIYKKPNQLSGGQMQRVAIARALINDPDILLADEPTGALDTQTSIQIMEILKNISAKKLIIMVTHNPELAQTYSNRIIRLLDGVVVDDSNPYVSDEDESAIERPSKKERKRNAAKGKKSMSFWTALSLSFNNLLTKKGRTFMTSFAGSIGIIGIALILSVSTGVNAYIASVQQDTLSTYPLTIEKETQDFASMLSAMTEVKELQENTDFDENKIYVDDSMGAMMSALSATKSNNLAAFKKYIEEHYDEIKDCVSDIQYTYDFDLQIFTADGKTQISPTTIFENMGPAFSGITEMMDTMGPAAGFNVMSEMINNQELLDQQYELVGEGSHWPQAANEVVLVVNQNNQISKMTLYMLGVLDQSELEDIMENLMMNGEYDSSSHMTSYALEDFLGMEFLLLNTADFYAKSGEKFSLNGKEYDLWYDMREGVFDQEGFVKQNGTTLKISGIVRPRAGAAAGSITGAVGYTKALTDEILARNAVSEILNQQKATPTHSVLTGLAFERIPYTRENIHELIHKVDDATMEQFYAYMTQLIKSTPEFSSQLVVNDAKSFLGFFAIMPSEMQTQLVQQMMDIAMMKDPTGESLTPILTYLNAMTRPVTVTKDSFVKLMPVLTTQQILFFLQGITTDVPGSELTPPLQATPGLIALCGEEAMQQIYTAMTAAIQEMTITEESFTLLLQGSFIPDDQFVELEEMLYHLAPQTDATYKSVLRDLGDAESASPAAINFFAIDFDSKAKVEDFIQAYNDSVPEQDRLEYTDVVGLLMSSLTTIIDAITYVLVAFVAISLIVSSIMIGIITYISVLERTKEIGILRSIGASKRDVRRVFNAETLIVGLISGVIGILSTLLLNIFINIILFQLTNIEALRAALPLGGALILIAISMALTVIAGLFPAAFAARRNPVEALRSE